MPREQRLNRVGSDERNISRLAPVLALERVPPGLTGWTKSVTIDALSAITMTCTAGERHVVPHGIDGDVILALTTMFVQQGMPADRYIKFSLAEMCQLLTFSRSKTTYERLRVSLLRLAHVKYEVTSAWVNYNRKSGSSISSKIFGIIDNLEVLSESKDWVPPLPGKPWQFQPTSQLQLALNSEIVRSIQSGYVRPVDLEYYGRLGPLTARKVYLMLEEARHDDPGCERFSFPLVSWGDHLGLREMVRPAEGLSVPETRPLRPDRIRRALDAAHAQLLKMGYLKEATYLGRGAGQTVHYRFGTVQVPADAGAVRLLTERGVAAGVAENHVRRLGIAAVHMAARRFDARKAGGYEVRNPGGLISDMLANPAKYLGTEATNAPTEARAHRALTASRKPVIDAEPVAPSTPERRKTNMFLLDNWQRSRHITAEQRKKLGVMIETGLLDDQLDQLLILKGRDAVQTFVRSVLP